MGDDISLARVDAQRNVTLCVALLRILLVGRQLSENSDVLGRPVVVDGLAKL